MDNTKDFAGTGMTFLEYKDKETDILNAHANGSITRDTMYKMLEDNRKAYNEWQECRRNPIDVTPMWERMEQLKRDLTGVIDVTPMKGQPERMEHPDRMGVIDVTSMKEQLDRVDEAQKRMRARRDEIANQWAKAYTEDGKIKVRKGRTGLPLVDMSVLEARLLAAQILSLTNPKIKRS